MPSKLGGGKVKEKAEKEAVKFDETVKVKEIEGSPTNQVIAELRKCPPSWGEARN